MRSAMRTHTLSKSSADGLSANESSADEFSADGECEPSVGVGSQRERGNHMITPAMLNDFQQRFDADPVNSVVAGAIARVGINETSLDNTALRIHDGVFSNITERGEITYQKSSGRCWIFAALNTARVDVMRSSISRTSSSRRTTSSFGTSWRRAISSTIASSIRWTSRWIRVWFSICSTRR